MSTLILIQELRPTTGYISFCSPEKDFCLEMLLELMKKPHTVSPLHPMLDGAAIDEIQPLAKCNSLVLTTHSSLDLSVVS